MDKTWTSYIILAIGIMMFIASDKYSYADDKHKAHAFSFNTESNMEVFINKDGDGDSKVTLLIDGKEHQFSIPELSDGESKSITTEDGKKVIIQSFSGDKTIVIDGKEINLPALGKHGLHKEGLSTVIGTSLQVIVEDDISISGTSGLSEDAQSAIVDAVKGVLTSYSIDKKVRLSKNNFNFHTSNHNGMKIIKKEGFSADGKELKLKFIGKGDGSIEHEVISIIHEQEEEEENQ